MYLLVIEDLFTKWIECQPFRRAVGPKIAESLEELIFSRWGAPKVLVTDNGTAFANRVIDRGSRYGIWLPPHDYTPYHQQANPVERVNRIIKTVIVQYIEENHRDWDLHIAHFRFAFNTAYHSSTQATPAFLNFGRNPLPTRCLKNVAEVT